MSKWRHIETAPKDRGGDYPVLCWWPSGEGCCEVSWHNGVEWLCFMSINDGRYEQPTHWMPLPSPPPNTKKK